MRSEKKARKNNLQSMKRVVFAALFGLMAGSVIPATAKPLKVSILAGQSNMEGHGKVEEGRNPHYDPKSPGSKPEIAGGLGSLRYLVNNPAMVRLLKSNLTGKGGL